MTIPSRPAPAPPQQHQISQQRSTTAPSTISIKLPPPPAAGAFQRAHGSASNTSSERSSITRNFPTARYAPATNWNGSPFDLPLAAKTQPVKKAPPPRPPPPRISPSTTGNTVLKKPGPPQSINVLSNLFGRRKGQTKSSKLQQTTQPINSNPLKLNSLSNVSQINSQNNRFATSQTTAMSFPNTSGNTEMELIKFDSPSSSPTFTQKSSSDCVSVDSFSSDSNFSSPQNGSVSQTESGFEDDFLSPSDPWDAFGGSENSINNVAPTSRNYGFINDIRVTQPVRNLNAINRSQNDNPLCNGKSLIPPQESLNRPTIIKPKSSVYSASNTSSPIHVGTNMKNPMSSLISSNNVNSNVADIREFQHFNEDESSPPMPNCPPPPPPSSSMLDVISGRLDAVTLCNNIDADDSASFGIALYTFEGTEDGDLSFKENEKVYILQRLSEGWYLGRNRRGCEGIFPSNYIEVKVPLKDDMPNVRLKTMQSVSPPSPTSYHPSKVRVLYNFNAEVQDDLTLKENDMVAVLFRINDDWLFGELDNRRGQFPANFLEYVPPNLPNNLP